MQYSSLSHFLRDGRATLAKGPVALIFAEDDVEVDSTVRHHVQAGFKAVVLFCPARIEISRDVAEMAARVDHDLFHNAPLHEVVTAVNRVTPAGVWLYYCYNAEYLFHPFCETRNVFEMLTFHTEERRAAMLTFVVDLYADDLDAVPSAVSLERAHLDKSGYYALARQDGQGHDKDRQLDFFGGLRWRFEEFVPKTKRRIDRVSFVRAAPGLQMFEDYTFSNEELNTFACPWHHNITATICSFRTAKALKRNPGSTFDIQSFKWHNSVPFHWTSAQLMDLGLMEPGQWF